MFAQNPNATPEEVSRYSPQFGMEMVKAQQEGQERAGRMRKTQNEISEQEMKIFSVVGGQVAEKYAPYAMSGQMTPEMLSQFHNEIGNATMQAEQQYGIRPPPGIDISKLDPMGVLTRAAPYYKSPVLENMMAVDKERMLSQVPPRMSSEQAYGGVDMGPYGPRLKPPLPRVNPPRNQPQQMDLSGMSLADGDTGETVPLTAENLPRLEQIYNKIPDVNIKSKVGTYLNQLRQQRQQPQTPDMGGGFVTPDQEIKLKAKEASAIEQAKEVTKAEVGREEEGKRITDAFKRAMGEGGVSRVMNLIAGSTSGKGEELLAKTAGAIPGVGATAGMENIGALNTIAGELRKTIERSPGPQSDKDVALAALDAAAIADPSIPYNQRMKGFLEFTRIIKERAKELGIDPKELGIDVDTVSGSNLPTAKNEAEAEAFVRTMKPGESFIGPDGLTHTIKGR